MNKVIIGTAGHVDHGKTTLIEALTGTDCDRWQEEKQRGITLDLGFAHLTDAEVQLSFVDVPGHERFLHNALAGLGGIGAVLLVIDAAEGVRAQTIEHLEVVRLLGIERVVVALTKIDSVDDDWLELVEVETRDFLHRQGFEEAPLLRVSAVAGDGLERLADELKRSALDESAVEGPTRLPVDRAFQITGRGTVVTGSPASGTIAPGDELAIDGSQSTVRVRRVEVHSQERNGAGVGERVAAQLSGAGPDDIPRGTQLVARDAFVRSRCFLARLTLLAETQPLESARDLRLHLFSADLASRIRPLEGPIAPAESGWVEGVLAHRTVLAAGDRAIVRRPSPAATLGGIEIVDPAWRRPRGKRLEKALRLIRQPDGLERWSVHAARLDGISATEFARRRGQLEPQATETLERLATDGHLLRLPDSDRFVDPGLIRDLAASATEDLDRHHREHPLEPGMPKAEFVRRHLAAVGDPAPQLQVLAAAGVLVERDGFVSRPSQGEQLDADQRRLADRIEGSLEELGFGVPSPAELARNLDAKPQIVEGLLHYLQRRDKAVKLPSGLWLASTTLERTIDDLRSTGWMDFSVGDFKDRYGLSRKWAIPVLEYLDTHKVTARNGDRRIVLRPS